MAKRMVNDAEKVNDLTEYMRQENNKTIIDGNLEVGGNLTVKGTAPGGASLHVYKVKGTAEGNEIYFLWTCDSDNMTVQSMTDALTYKLSSGSGFGMGIPAIQNYMGYYTCTVAYEGGLKVYTEGTHSADLTISTVYKIY